MSVRIQILVEPDEKHRIQRAARLAKMSVGGWLRKLALERLDELERPHRFRSAEDLVAFFARVADDEGCEPDWEEHEGVISQSIAAGRATS